MTETLEKIKLDPPDKAILVAEQSIPLCSIVFKSYDIHPMPPIDRNGCTPRETLGNEA